MSKSKSVPAPEVNPTKANLPPTTKTKAQPSQAHQGMSEGLINIAAHDMLQHRLEVGWRRQIRRSGVGYATAPTLFELTTIYPDTQEPGNRLIAVWRSQDLADRQWPHSQGCVQCLLAMPDANAEKVAP